MLRLQEWSWWRNLCGEENVERYQNERQDLRYLYDHDGSICREKYRQLLVCTRIVGVQVGILEKHLSQLFLPVDPVHECHRHPGSRRRWR